MTRDGLAALANFAAPLDEPAGTWRGGGKDADGTIQMPWFDLSPLPGEFHQAAYDHGLVLSFDWPDRTGTDEGRRWMSANPPRPGRWAAGPASGAGHSHHARRTLRRGITGGGMDDGRLPAIIRRIAVLAA